MAKLILEVEGKNAQAQARALASELEKLGIKAKVVEGGLDRASKSSRGLSSTMGQLKAAIATLGVVALVRSIQETVFRLDQFDRTFRAAAGGVAAGAAEMTFARQEAERLGIAILPTLESYSKFSVAARLAGLSLSETRDVFSSVAETATILGLSAAEVRLAFLALEQMASKGRVSMEELRRQLGEKIPGAVQIAAKGLSVTTAALFEMVEAGEVTAQELLPAFGRELRNTFGSELPNAINSVQAQWNRFLNSALLLSEAIGREFVPAISEAAQRMGEMAKSEEFLSFARDVGRAVAVIIRSFGSLIDTLADLGISWGNMRAQVAEATAGVIELTGDLAGSLTDLFAGISERLGPRFRGAGPWGLGSPEELRSQADEIRNNARTLADSFLEVAGEQRAMAENAKAAAAGLEALDLEASQLGETVAGLTKEELKRLDSLLEKLGLRPGQIAQSWDLLTRAFRENRISADELNEALRRLVDVPRMAPAFQELMDELGSLRGGRPLIAQLPVTGVSQEFIDSLVQLGDAVVSLQEVPEAITKIAPASDRVLVKLRQLTNEGKLTEEQYRQLAAFFRDEFAAAMGSAAERAGEIFKSRMIDALTDALSALITGAKLSGAQIGQAIGSAAGAAIGTYFGGAQGGQIGAQLGGAVGQLLGTVLDSSNDTIATIQVAASGMVYGSGQLEGAARQMLEAIQQFEALTGASVQSMLGVTINLKENGDVWVNLANGISRRFSEVGAAISFALVEMLRSAELAGAPEEVLAVLRNSTAQTFEQLQEELAFALDIRRLDMSSVEQFFDDLFRVLQQNLDRAAQLGLDPTPLFNQLGRDLAAERDRILGIQKDIYEQRLEEARQFNDLLAARRAQIESELAVAVASLEQVLGLLATMTNITHEHAAQVLFNLQQQAAILQATVTALQGQLAALPAPIDPSQIRVGGGGGRRAQRESLTDQLQRIIDGAVQGVAAIIATLRQIQELEEEIARLGPDAALAAEALGILREQSLQQAQQSFLSLAERMAELIGDEETLKALQEIRYDLERAQLRLQVEALAALGLLTQEQIDLLNSLLGRLPEDLPSAPEAPTAADGFGLSDLGIESERLRDQFGHLREVMEALGLVANEAGTAMALLTPEAAAVFQELRDQLYLTFGDRLLSFLDRYYSEVAGREDFRRQLEQVRFNLELAQLRLQFQLLRDLGLLTAEVIAQIEGFFGFIDENPPDWDQLFNVDPPLRAVTTTFDDMAGAAERLLDRLKRAKEGIAEFLAEMAMGQFGGVSPREALAAAQMRFDEALRLARGGDIGALESITGVASDLLSLARGAFASSPEFQRIFESVQAGLGGLLGVTRVTEGTLTVDERLFRIQEEHRNVSDRGFRVNSEQNERIIGKLDAVEQMLGRINQAFAGAAAERARMSAGKKIA